MTMSQQDIEKNFKMLRGAVKKLKADVDKIKEKLGMSETPDSTTPLAGSGSTGKTAPNR